MYGEVDAVERKQMEAHLATCAACAAEVRALGDVRSELDRWAPPDAELGFAIVRRSDAAGDRESAPPAKVLRPAQWWTTVPRWAQAAAAVLVLAAGAAIANVQVSSSAEGFSVTTGWMKPALSEPIDGAAIERRVEGRVEQALVSLEQQLRAEIRTARDTSVRTAVPAAAADDATIRRVEQLLAESERRQEQAMAMRFVEFNRDMNIQRRADLITITKSLGQVDEQMYRQRQMMNNVLRVSATPQQ